MSGRRDFDVYCIPRLSLLFVVIVLFGIFSRPAWCADGGEGGTPPAAIPLVTSLIYSQISNLTKVFHKDITDALGYCVKDV